MSTNPRPATAVDAIADAFVDDLVRLSPISATELGLPGAETELDDFSPDGRAAVADTVRGTLTKLAAAEVADDVDRVTVAAMQERLG
ncbi:DUF885 family protein, partial [Pseudactinotalea suaedae]